MTKLAFCGQCKEAITRTEIAQWDNSSQNWFCDWNCRNLFDKATHSKYASKQVYPLTCGRCDKKFKVHSVMDYWNDQFTTYFCSETCRMATEIEFEKVKVQQGPANRGDSLPYLYCNYCHIKMLPKAIIYKNDEGLEFCSEACKCYHVIRNAPPTEKTFRGRKVYKEVDPNADLSAYGEVQPPKNNLYQDPNLCYQCNKDLTLTGCIYNNGYKFCSNDCSDKYQAYNFPPLQPPPNNNLNTRDEPPANRYQYITQERASIYGDVRISHRAIGYAFRAILQNRWHHIEVPEIPDELTALLLAAFKTTRAARPTFHKDSYDDNHNYLTYSEEMREEDYKKGK